MERINALGPVRFQITRSGLTASADSPGRSGLRNNTLEAMTYTTNTDANPRGYHDYRTIRATTTPDRIRCPACRGKGGSWGETFSFYHCTLCYGKRWVYLDNLEKR